MPSASFFALFDDIALLLDDVAAMTKVAAKKTAGVLGDDLAVNAEQVSGVRASRELPVVWAVAKGSFLNKFILVPSALLISAFLPWLIVPLLILGGLFLCFEGAEKIIEMVSEKRAAVAELANNSNENAQSKSKKEQKHEELLNAVKQSPEALMEFEKGKIKGAIRTDFVLSAEIIIIALGSFADAPITNQIIALCIVAVAMTVGVYGLVALIVRLDDVGLRWQLGQSQSPTPSLFTRFKGTVGGGLLIFAPRLMQSLSVIGLVAMFLVGGGMLTHNIEFVHHISAIVLGFLDSNLGVIGWLNTLVSILLDGAYGVIAGLMVAGVIHILPFPKAAHS